MKKFDFHTPQSDLLSFSIESDRLKLLIIDNKFEQDIFREFTEEITTYMIPSPTKNIQETRDFIADSRRGIEAGYNLRRVLGKKILTQKPPYNS